MVVGCSAILGFDKEVGSADDPLSPNDGDAALPPGTEAGSTDGSTTDDFDATYPEDDAGSVVVEPYLDPTFGGQGTGRVFAPGVAPSVGSGPPTCATVITEDAAVWIACCAGGSSSASSILYRIKPDGTLDTTIPSERLMNLAIRGLAPRGNTVLGVGETGAPPRNVIAQFTAEGVLDTTFGTKGLMATSTGNTDPSRWWGVGREGATTLRLWGTRSPIGTAFYVPITTTFDLTANTFSATLTGEARFSGSSTLDPGFFPVGVVPVDGTALEFFGMYGSITSGSVRTHGVFRLRNGAPDGTFGSNGLVTQPYSDTNQTEISSGVIIGDKLLLATSLYQYGEGLLARFTLDGALDPTFGTGGFQPLRSPEALTPGAPEFIPSAVLPLPGGKFMVAGKALPKNGTSTRILVGRFNADGSADTTFGSAGFVSPKIETTPTKEMALGLALQPDAHVVVTGLAEAPSGAFRLFALRLKP